MDEKGPVLHWIYGAGGFAKRLASALEKNNISIAGMITRSDFKEDFEVNPNDVWYLGIFNHLDDPHEIIEFLSAKGIKNIVSPARAILELQDASLSTYFLTSEHNKLCSAEEIELVSQLLEDIESKEILNGFVNYQSTGDLSRLHRSAKHEIQYLGKTLNPTVANEWFSDPVNWIDCGAYNGDTVKAVYQNCVNREVKFLNFEPDEKNFNELNSLTQGLNINALNIHAACGQMAQSALMISGQGLSSQIVTTSTTGLSAVETKIVSIDSINNFSPTHIKMDIEGFEIEALKGAAKTITKYLPKLAIAVYHKPRDVYEIPKLISSLHLKYRYFLRCYGAHGYDTVLYAIPEV